LEEDWKQNSRDAPSRMFEVVSRFLKRIDDE